MRMEEIIDSIEIWDELRKKEFYDLYNNVEETKKLAFLLEIIEEMRNVTRGLEGSNDCGVDVSPR